MEGNTELIQQIINAEVANVVALITVIILVIMWQMWRSRSVDQKANLQIVNVLTNADSPIVKSMHSIDGTLGKLAGLQAESIERDKQQTEVLAMLGVKIDTQTGAITTLTSNVSKYQVISTETAAALTARINDLEAAVNKSLNDVRTEIRNLPSCERFTEQLESVKREILAEIQAQKQKIATQEVERIVLPPATVTATPIPLGDIEDKAA